MDDYKKYLAENILTEDKVITYRLLSRALRIHVNTAKRMLCEFHQLQNEKRPGSVHATYLVYGTKKNTNATPAKVGDDDDIEMSISAPEIETRDVIVVSTLSLVQESRLKDELAEYEDISSIHVYSLGSQPAKDYTLISDVARKMSDTAVSGDVFKERNLFGTITNSHARRRPRKAGPKPPAAPGKQEVKPAPKSSAAPATKVKAEPKAVSSASAKEKASSAPAKEKASSSAPAKKAAAVKGGIMAAFSKAKPKKTVSAQATMPSGDDLSMHPMSDDGEDDVVVLQPKACSSGTQDCKKQREEELRRMMEEEDEEMEDEPEKADSPEEEPVEEPPVEEPQMEESAEVTTSAANGRRRGKRKVMKKKQIMDEQGYLVTKQEAVWEPFSEDEAPPPKPTAKPEPTKPKAASSVPAGSSTKSKKGGGKGTQGNIMSFFSKKT